MRKILYKKRHSYKNRRKSFSIAEFAEDKDCRTIVRKTFIYKVKPGQPSDCQAVSPEVFIKKQLDNKKHRERFAFKVKGAFYLKQNRCGYKVEFCHYLKIDIFWKSHIFSPKKSETLT